MIEDQERQRKEESGGNTKEEAGDAYEGGNGEIISRTTR